jgi:plasmid maintenance system antidote protein VapI
MALTNKKKIQRLSVLVERARLADLLQDVIERRFGGNLSKTADKFGMTQPTLFALVHGRRESIRPVTLKAIFALVGKANAREVRRCLLTPHASQLLHVAHYAHQERWLAHLWLNLQRGNDEAQKEVERRQTDFETALRHIRRKFLSYCNAFEKSVAALGHSPERLSSAYSHILQDALVGAAGGHIERHWTEMSSSELRRFVEFGMRRELILLRRSPDFARAHEQVQQGLVPPSALAPKRPLDVNLIAWLSHPPRRR